MENLNVFVEGDNQVNQEKPPPRVCPRCNSNNTKFCYYNNYSMSQPRYNCRNCRRSWTHGGALRNIPIGGSGRKIQRARIDQPSVSQVVSVEIQQVSVQVYHHQPFLHVQETHEFAEFLRGSSSSSLVSVGNHFGSLPGVHGGMVLPTRSFRPMDRSDFHDGSFQQDYYDVGSNDLIGNPLINQSIGGSTVVGYRNQEDQNKWNPSFNNIMNTNHNASTSGSRGSAGTDHINMNNGIVRNNCVCRSCYHLEKHGRP